MTLANDFTWYKEEIALIRAQNRVECDMYSLIINIIRKNSEKISIRDVSTRRSSTFSEVFIGESGFPDFVIRERALNNNAKVLGAVEIKYIGNALDKHLNQLQGHINSYKKVIFTNGLNWRYYNSNNKPEWENNIGILTNEEVVWEKESAWKDLLIKIGEIDWFN